MTTASSTMLEKLAAGLGVMLVSLFDPPPAAGRAPESPVARRADQPSEPPSRAMIAPGWSVRRVQELDERQIDELPALMDCVEGGASVSFMQPLARARAVAFWRRAAESVAAGERALSLRVSITRPRGVVTYHEALIAPG